MPPSLLVAPPAVAPVLDISSLYVSDISDAAFVLDTHGCCVFRSCLEDDFLLAWRLAMGKVDRKGCSEREPFDGTHFSFNSCRDLPTHHYQRLIEDQNLRHVVNTLLTPGWCVNRCGGDVVTGGSTSAQPLHSDWDKYPTSSMKWSYALVASIALCDVPAEHAALRVVPWSVPGWQRLPYPDKEEQGSNCPIRLCQWG